MVCRKALPPPPLEDGLCPFGGVALTDRLVAPRVASSDARVLWTATLDTTLAVGTVPGPAKGSSSLRPRAAGLPYVLRVLELCGGVATTALRAQETSLTGLRMNHTNIRVEWIGCDQRLEEGLHVQVDGFESLKATVLR